MRMGAGIHIRANVEVRERGVDLEFAKIGQRTLQQYFKEIHKDLLEAYNTSGSRQDVCGFVAREIVDALKQSCPDAQVKHLQLYGINGQKQFPPNIEGLRKSFWTHRVCLSEGLVYDPLVAEPLPMPDYLRRAFGFESAGPEEAGRIDGRLGLDGPLATVFIRGDD